MPLSFRRSSSLCRTSSVVPHPMLRRYRRLVLRPPRSTVWYGSGSTASSPRMCRCPARAASGSTASRRDKRQRQLLLALLKPLLRAVVVVVLVLLLLPLPLALLCHCLMWWRMARLLALALVRLLALLALAPPGSLRSHLM